MSDSKTKHTLPDLRETLFETLDAVKNKNMDLDRAKVVANIAQTIINSASAQVRALNALGSGGFSDAFFGSEPEPKRLQPEPKRLQMHGAPAELPPSRVVDPLRTVREAPPEEQRRDRTQNGGR